MKNRKTRIIMGIMVGLVLFSSSVALLLYLKEDKLKENKQAYIEVFVAAKNIAKGDELNATSLKRAKLPKSYIGFTPLTDTEIIGRFAKVNIYKGEPIRQEKISMSKPTLQMAIPTKTLNKKTLPKQTTVKKIVQESNDAISVPFSMFKNKDSSLRSGDFVDIACAVPSTKKADVFYTKYVALHVKIDNFVNNGTVIAQAIAHNAKKQAIQADTVILQMSPKEIKNFLAFYYKTQTLNNNRVYNTNNYGGQLWMIKTPKIVNTALQKQKELLLVDRKTSKKRRKKQLQRAKISYEN
ncbi:SAF domain-containing protein [Sulfurimonas sp.]